MPSVELLFGPFLIGLCLNSILYGILLVQSFIYYRTYTKDPPRLRYFILFLVICDTLNTVFDIGVLYEPLVFRYGTPRATQRIPVMLYVDPIMTVIISTSVQLFSCWRIGKITNSWIIPSFISVFVFCSLVGGIALTICSRIVVDFSQLESVKGAIITWLGSSAITDICITASLVVSLTKQRTGYADTDDAVDRIIRLTIHTGAVTTLFATLDLVLFVAVPNTSLNFAFDFPLAKLYTNSLLSTLNARGGWYTTAQQRPHDSVLELSNPTSSTTRKTPTDEYVHSEKITTSLQAFSLPDITANSQTSHQQRDVETFNIDLESVVVFHSNDEDAVLTTDVTTSV